MNKRLHLLFWVTSVWLIVTLASPPPAKADLAAPAAPIHPVIVLPGMTASINYACFFSPLNTEQYCNDEALWGWMPTAESYYKPLLERLEQAGYTRASGYSSVFFYDWRKNIADNLPRLKAYIAAIKIKTGAAQVDLVGHSMGGLLARAYVQDAGYGNDVERLVTLGTPHYGSAKSFPPWEAGYLYKMDPLEAIGFPVTLAQLGVTPQIPVLALRSNIPGTQNLLPTRNYVYDEFTGIVRPESLMVHRNNFLPDLNANLSLLFSRLGNTDVASFVATGKSTTYRFLVHPFPYWNRPPWEWLNWLDGEPNWSMQAQFENLAGDGTVESLSAALPAPSYSPVFNGVEHGMMPADNAVIDELFSFLGITVSTQAVAYQQGSALFFGLNGPAEATITDPSGRVIGPSGMLGAQAVIPGAQYAPIPGTQVKYIIIPDPLEGSYQVTLTPTGGGMYELRLLDTFGKPPELVSDWLSEWDIAISLIEPSTTVSLALSYAGALQEITMQAVTPLIQLPVYEADKAISGRALPGVAVEIRDAGNRQLLGNGTAGLDGKFSVMLTSRLHFQQRILAHANGLDSVPVMVESLRVYLPLVVR